MLRKLLRCALLLSIFSQTLIAQEFYRKATEDREVVKNKLYPKKKKVEFAVSGGHIFNQSMIVSFLSAANVSYYPSEFLGLHLEFSYFFNEDKQERDCLEMFFNDAHHQVGAVCPGEFSDELDDSLKNADGSHIGGANFGPAYMPIRELKYSIMAGATWNAIYGKQLAFLNFISFFDIFIEGSAGVAFSKFYPMSKTLRDGRLSRGEFPEGVDTVEPLKEPGVSPLDPEVNNLIGIKGRPDPSDEISPLLNSGVGIRYHFWKRMHLRAEIKNQFLISKEGLEYFLMFWGGLGIRF